MWTKNYPNVIVYHYLNVTSYLLHLNIIIVFLFYQSFIFKFFNQSIYLFYNFIIIKTSLVLIIIIIYSYFE